MTARHFGTWENESGAKVLEILSHPGTATYPDTSGGSTQPDLYGKGSTDLGNPYAYLVGLTGKLSTGAQSVQARTFAYTGATLSAGVTRLAASHAARMPGGVLARLQIRFDPSTTESQTSAWEDVWIGQFQGMKWNGSDYTLSFVDALQAVKQKHTEAATTTAPEDYYKWFAGCGNQTTLTAGWPGGTAFTTASDLELVGSAATIGRDNWGNTAKKHDGFGGTAYHYATDPSGTGDLLQWVKASNTSGSRTYLSYNIANVAGTTLSLHRCKTYGGAEALPGFHGVGADDTAVTGLDAGSIVTNVCVIHGSPVSELVNTVYNQGYPEEMVPGLFSSDWGRATSHPRSPMNLSDIGRTAGRFDGLFTSATGIVGSFAASPFRHVVAKEQADGLSYMLRLFGKWGVFPRFKEGGWSVGVIQADLPGYSSAAEAVIFTNDIEGADFDTRASGTIGGFRELAGTESDEDASGVTPALTFTGIDLTGGRTYFGSPQLGQLTVDTSDVAAGSSSGQPFGQRFLTYFREVLYPHWYQANRVTATLRLRGLKFAGLAPGDEVHVCIPRGKQAEPWGPLEPFGSSMRHVLDTSSFEGTHQQARENVTVESLVNYKPWVVMSSQVDWIGGRVTVTVSKVSTTKAAKDWSLFPGGPTDQTEQHAVATVHHKDD